MTKVFESHGAPPKVAVGSVSFTVRKGEVFGLLGVNGAGKSTLFKLLAGEIQPTWGSAYFEGLEIR
jgi:ABC-type multidrug transport system ATPase subunit